MIRWDDLAILAEGREHREISACAGRAYFGYFGNPKTSRERELALVSHVLIAKHQNGILFEGRTDRSVGCIVQRGIAQCDAAQLRGKAGAKREDIHRRSSTGS